MRFHLPAAAASAALFCFATPLASATEVVAAEAKPVVTDVGHNTVPEPEVPFQVVAFAGALLIWRNRRRTSRD